MPIWGDVKNSYRYNEVLNKTLKENPNVKHIVGHSLGGSVALELQKNYPQYTTRTYSAPVVDFGILNKDQAAERYRNRFDPVSIFDRRAESSLLINPLSGGFSGPHTYNNIGTKFESKGNINAYGYVNANNTISLTQ